MNVISCSSSKQKAKKEVSDSAIVVSVKTMQVKNEQIELEVDYTANLVANEEVHLAPASPGRIDKIYIEIGDKIEKGQLVAVMDKTNLEQARINLMKLETDYKRLDTLKKQKVLQSNSTIK